MKRNVKRVFLVCFLLGTLLISCDVRGSCALQAVAGGAQYCQEQAVR